MTRLASALAAILLAALASDAHGQRHMASDENTLRLTVGDDHGNARSSATPVALPSTTGGSIETPGDVDYFRFEVSDTQLVSIGTGGSLGTSGTLYDGDGVLLDEDDGSGPFRIERILSAGTYYVVVAPYVARTGAYTLLLEVEDDDATPVALPSTTGGRIETLGDVDYFRFEVSDTQQVTIETSGNTNTLGWLFGRSCVSLPGGCFDDDRGSGSNFSIQISLKAGTYYVQVESYGVGAYTLRLAVGDDHGNAPSEATPATLPDERHGWIQTASDVDYFQFEISDPHRVSISTSWFWAEFAAEPIPPQPRIALYASDGGLLESNDNGGFDSSIERGLSAGTYYIRVATNGGSTGRYVLSLWWDDHGNTLSSATRVALPSTTAGQINAAGGLQEGFAVERDVDYFRFEVSDMQPVSIGTGGALDTLGRLYGGNGGHLASDNNRGPGLNFRIRRILSAGTYYVGVESYGGLTGAYTLFLEVQDATPVALPSRTDGRIDTHDDVDYFRFEVSDAQPVSIGTGGALDTSGTLYDGDGGLLEWKRDHGGNFRIRRILSAGTYYVGVESYDGPTGAYTLLLGVEDATLVALPSTTGGRIETLGDVYYFRFEVSDTQQVTIETSGNTNTRGRLFGRSCVSLPRACDALDGGSGSNFSIQISLQAGTYYVRVESDGGSGDPLEGRVGAYTLRLAVGDDHGNAPSEATPVTLPDGRNGWIQTASDVDYFQFDISDPHRVFINTSWFWAEFAGEPIPPRPRIALYASDGRLLESNDNGGFDSSIERGLSAGTYYIRVATNHGSTGRYVLSFWWDDHGDTLSSATRVALPSTTAEHITAGDVDYFRFEVTRTQWVSITTSGDGFFHTDGFLYDGDGGFLEGAVDSHWCGSGFSFALNLSPGTYYIRITPNRDGETGAYTLRLALSRTACDDDHGDTRSSATRVALPSTTTGRIGPFDDADYFRFEVTHEQRVSISVSSKSGIFSSLSNADGDLLVYLPYTDRGIRAISMRTLSAGTYYVVVTESSGIEAGAYTLRLEVAPLYADELRLPLDALAPDAPGELRWTAAYSSDESMASVRIEDGELVVEPAYAAEGLVRIEATATDSDGGTVTAIFDVQVEFYSPRRPGTGWRSAVLSD